VQACYLRWGLEKTSKRSTASRTLGSPTPRDRSGRSHRRPDHSSRKAGARERGRTKSSRSSSSTRKAPSPTASATTSDRDLVGRHREDRRRGVQRNAGDRTGRENFNPVLIHGRLRARADRKASRQLRGMRGLMAKPSRNHRDAVTSNFREGLTVLQLLHLRRTAPQGSGRHGVEDGRLGYLTNVWWTWPRTSSSPRWVSGTLDGIEARAIIESGRVSSSHCATGIIGRVTLERLVDPFSNEPIIEANQEIDEELGSAIQDAGIEKVKIRPVLTCASAPRRVREVLRPRPARHARWSSLGGRLSAAQSIGEPGTQWTMRTFPISAARRPRKFSEQSTLERRTRHRAVPVDSAVEPRTARCRDEPQRVAILQDAKGRDRERYPIVYGARCACRGQQNRRGPGCSSSGIPIRSRSSPRSPGRCASGHSRRITVHEEWTRSPAVAVDHHRFADEKKQPAIGNSGRWTTRARHLEGVASIICRALDLW